MNLDKVIQIKCEAKSYYQLDDLNHFQGKLKSIDKDRFDKLKKSLIRDGLPIGFHVWIDKKNKVWTIDGHHRVLALKALRDDGYDIPSLPCVIVQANNKKEAAKAVLINNSKYAKINQESLSDFMIDFELNIDDLNFLDLPDLNMDDFGLDEKTKEGLTDDDAVPEVEQNIHGVTLGNIYQLGNHRLMCGDSTSIDAVEKLMDGQKADMVFTDPPYGVSIKNKKGSIKGDDSLDVFNKCLPVLKISAKESAHVYIYFGVQFTKECIEECQKYFKQNNILIQRITHENKPSPDGYFKSNYELCYFSNPSGRAFNHGHLDVSDSTLNDSRYTGNGKAKTYPALLDIKATEHNLKSVHPTQKTVAICEFYQNVSSHKEDAVIDLFGGSGSTLIACEKTNRKCFMMELDPHYCSVIIERWQNFTGLKAKLITK